MAKDKDKLEQLRNHLKQLKLDKVTARLDAALENAEKLKLGRIDFLLDLLGEEAIQRHNRAVERRVYDASFSETKTFDTFDWKFQPELNVGQVKDLAELRFIEEARPLLLLGKPGTGKTHLAIAFGMRACERGYRVRFYKAKDLFKALYATLADDTTQRFLGRLTRHPLLIIDELAYFKGKPEHAYLFFDLMQARYEKAATILTSNLRVSEWGDVLGDAKLTAAIVDRLMHRAHVINIKNGRSYRSEGPDGPGSAILPSAERDDR
jgi:DNA replication protein DnaC